MSHIGIGAMENEDRLKLQAWLDGELPTHEAARVADWVEANPSARELTEELRAVKVALKVGEMPVSVEDSREFTGAKSPARSTWRRAPNQWSSRPRLGWSGAVNGSCQWAVWLPSWS